MSLTNTQIGLVILVIVAVGYLIYSAKCNENFAGGQELNKKGSYNYIGSFKDHPNRRINKLVGIKSFDECLGYAKNNGKTFFGFQDPIL